MAIKTSIEIGTQFRHHYADSNPLWTVTSKVADDVYEAMIEDDLDYGGHVDVFLGEAIRRSLRMDRFFEDHAAKVARYEDSVEVGQILHHHNSFGKYIRGEVVLNADGEKVLRPIGVVGNYHPTMDLPRRMPNGTIYAGDTFIRAILTGEPAWALELGIGHQNTYESPDFSGPGGEWASFDPRTADLIDLTVPEPTPDEAADIETYRQYEAVRDLIQGDGAPRDAAEAASRLRMVQEFLRGVEIAE
ncbi:MAG TPA: hypothetical protein VK088_08840 [Acidimicrobiia bacterium]|nr:hypothetical protein [Acidimicrobiia bacterium]